MLLLASVSGKLEPLAGAGVSLTRWVLLILTAVLVVLISAACYQEKQFTDILAASLQSEASPVRTTQDVQPNSAEDLKARQELLKTYQDVVNASREFWMKLGQMVLLNLLLPVLTALLGYVFASRSVQK
jgi:apolipoprotein N-acyltransferase